MRILSIISRGYPVSGGAQIANIAFLKKLSGQFGHRCYVYTDFPVKKQVSFGRVKLHTFRDTEELKQEVRKVKPDLIISGLEISYYAVKLAGQLGIPVFVYMHSFEFCPPAKAERKKWKVSLGREYAPPEKRNFVFRKADAVIVNSYYLKRRLKRYGVDSKVIYPEFEKSTILSKNFKPSNAKYITGICGHSFKGADLFYRLADKFRQEKFLLVGSVDSRYYAKFRKQKNITIMPFTQRNVFLKKSKAVLVPSQWPEPFGLIAVEAMANGIPVLASFTGGLKEVVRDSPLGVKNFRKAEAWQRRLGELLSSEKAYALNSQAGKRLSKRFLKDSSLKELDRMIRKSVLEQKPCFNTKKVVAFCGKTTKKTAYSSINSRWFNLLNKEKEFSAVNLSRCEDLCAQPVDFFIHHDYQHDFKKISPPDEGKLIAVRTWDFGRFPAEWVKKINTECDQLWVYSNWVGKQAAKSGIDPKRVKVVPPGFSDRVFKPQGGSYKLPTDKKFKFIFVGATVLRKGIDILLKAYGRAFTPGDDVCLVIKDKTKDVFYSGISFKEKILQLARDKRYPQIIYLDKYLTEQRLASLYRSCDIGVFPYRAEGFVMPIVEAMACGLPCIVPNFGPCLDFCSQDNAFLLPVKRINLPVNADFAINTLGFKEKVEEVDFCEIEIDVLAAYLRKVFQASKEAIQRKSGEGIKKMQREFTWEISMRKLKEQLGAISGDETPVRLKQSRLLNKRNGNLFEIAKRAYLASKDLYPYGK